MAADEIAKTAQCITADHKRRNRQFPLRRRNSNDLADNLLGVCRSDWQFNLSVLPENRRCCGDFLCFVFLRLVGFRWCWLDFGLHLLLAYIGAFVEVGGKSVTRRLRRLVLFGMNVAIDMITTLAVVRLGTLASFDIPYGIFVKQIFPINGKCGTHP